MDRQSLTLEHVLSLAAALRAVLELGDRRLRDAEIRIEEQACRFAADQGILSPPEIRRGVQASRLDKRPLSSVQAYVQASPALEQAIYAGAFALCPPQGPNEAQRVALSTIASFTPDGTSRLRFAILRFLRTPADEQHAQSIKRALDELELEGDATREAIASRFRQLSKELHPDKTQDSPEAAREAARKRFIRIKDAFDLLMDSRWWCRSPTTPSPIEATHALDVGCFFCETATSLPPPGEALEASRCPHCQSNLVFDRETADLIVTLARPRERGRDSAPQASKNDTPPAPSRREDKPKKDGPRPASSPKTHVKPHPQRGPLAVIGAGLLAMIGFLMANAVFSTPSAGTGKPTRVAPRATPVNPPLLTSPLKEKRDSLQRDHARLAHEADVRQAELGELLAAERFARSRIESLEVERDRLISEKSDRHGVLDQTIASLRKATQDLEAFRNKYPDPEGAAREYAAKRRSKYIDAQLQGFWQEQEALDQKRAQFGGVWPSQQSIDNQVSRIVQAAEPAAKRIERGVYDAWFKAFDKEEARLTAQCEEIRSAIDASRSRVTATDQRLAAIPGELADARATAASAAPKREKAQRAFEAATASLQRAVANLQRAEAALSRSYEGQRPPSPGDLHAEATEGASGR